MSLGIRRPESSLVHPFSTGDGRFSVSSHACFQMKHCKKNRGHQKIFFNKN
jgi:hypothetical protein